MAASAGVMLPPFARMAERSSFSGLFWDGKARLPLRIWGTPQPRQAKPPITKGKPAAGVPAGKIVFDGKEVAFAGPLDAREAGIETAAMSVGTPTGAAATSLRMRSASTGWNASGRSSRIDGRRCWGW